MVSAQTRPASERDRAGGWGLGAQGWGGAQGSGLRMWALSCPKTFVRFHEGVSRKGGGNAARVQNIVFPIRVIFCLTPLMSDGLSLLTCFFLSNSNVSENILSFHLIVFLFLF